MGERHVLCECAMGHRKLVGPGSYRVWTGIFMMRPATPTLLRYGPGLEWVNCKRLLQSSVYFSHGSEYDNDDSASRLASRIIRQNGQEPFQSVFVHSDSSIT